MSAYMGLKTPKGWQDYRIIAKFFIQRMTTFNPAQDGHFAKMPYFYPETNLNH